MHTCSGRGGSAVAVGGWTVVEMVAGSAVIVAGVAAVVTAVAVSAVASTSRESDASRLWLVVWSRRLLHSSACVPDTLPVTVVARVFACVSWRACPCGCWAPVLVAVGP